MWLVTSWVVLTKQEIVAVSFWFAALLIAAGFSLRYEKTPTMLDSKLERFPASSKLKLNQSGFTMLFFVHPKCPCTQASLAELARLKGKNPSLTGYIALLVPHKSLTSWMQSANCQRARQVVGFEAVPDYGGLEAACFGAKSSGEAFLFNSAGKLLFHGGLTAARGHEGPNSGVDQITSILEGKSRSGKYAVYGCSLQNPVAVSAMSK